jgi:hypothetical protein
MCIQATLEAVGQESDGKFRIDSRVLLKCSRSSTYSVPRKQALKSSSGICPVHYLALPSFAVASVVATPVFVAAAAVVVALQASRKQSTRLNSQVSAV